jgi:hypothetical protein
MKEGGCEVCRATRSFCAEMLLSPGLQMGQVNRTCPWSTVQLGRGDIRGNSQEDRARHPVGLCSGRPAATSQRLEAPDTDPPARGLTIAIPTPKVPWSVIAPR